MPTLFPSLIPGEDFVDNAYGERELERMERTELQKLAAKHESDEINGQSSNDSIRDFLEGEERL